MRLGHAAAGVGVSAVKRRPTGLDEQRSDQVVATLVGMSVIWCEKRASVLEADSPLKAWQVHRTSLKLSAIDQRNCALSRMASCGHS
jgi:hypothetical protein